MINPLWRGILDEQLKLTAEQRSLVRKRVQELYGRHKWVNSLRLAPGLSAVLFIPVWTRLAASWSIFWRAVFELAYAAIIVAFIYWIFRFANTRYARRAVRELGYANICSRCGYDLSHLDASSPACPECGMRIADMPRPGERMS